MNESPQESTRAHPEQATSRWEWATAGLGGLIVAAIAGYLVHFGISNPDGVPDPIVEHISTSAVQSGYLVRFKVRNAGNATAASLQIRGELLADGVVRETEEVTIDYLPQISEREGGLFFNQDPRALDLRLRAGGYLAP